MKKIGIYTRHKLQKFAFQLKLKLEESNDVFIFSEDNLYDKNILNAEKYFSYSDEIVHFSENEINEIITRCRVLRSIEINLAIMLLKRASQSVLGIIETIKPDLIITPRIDDYFLDILDRVSKKKGVQNIGLWKSAFQQNMFFLTKRGEYIKLRDPSKEEINNLITNISSRKFKATSIVNGTYNHTAFLKKFIYIYIRSIILELLRRVSINKYRYREMATRFFVDEYNIPLLKSYYTYKNWRYKFNAIKISGRKKVFIGLQVNPESTIDYYCDNLEFINILETATKVIQRFIERGFDVIIKDHPNMLASRNKDFLDKLNNISHNVVVVPTSIDSTYLIELCDVTFTWSGTIAVQSLMFGKQSISICSTYYLPIAGFYKLINIDCLDEVIEKIINSNFENNIHTNDIEQLATHILSSHEMGNIYWHNSQCKNDIAITADSILRIINQKYLMN